MKHMEENKKSNIKFEEKQEKFVQMENGNGQYLIQVINVEHLYLHQPGSVCVAMHK